MKLQSAAGERLYKQVVVTVLFPDKKRKIRTPHKAAPGQGFTAKNIESILGQWAEKIEQDFPMAEYRLVPLGPAEFKFVPAP